MGSNPGYLLKSFLLYIEIDFCSYLFLVFNTYSGQPQSLWEGIDFIVKLGRVDLVICLELKKHIKYLDKSNPENPSCPCSDSALAVYILKVS